MSVSELALILIAILGTAGTIILVWRLVRKQQSLALHQLSALEDAISSLPTREYIPMSVVEEWQRHHDQTIAMSAAGDRSRFLKTGDAERYRLLRSHLRDIPAFVRQLNEAFIQRRT